MAEYIALPDGSYLQLKEGQSPLEGAIAARALFPELFAKEESAPAQDTTGFKAAASAGLERLGGEFELLKGKLGIKDEAEAQREYEAAQKRAEARFTPTQDDWSESPWQKIKETAGGSLPYMVAPAAAGLAAAFAPVSVPVATALGLGAAGLASAGQFTGSNLGAQVETGKTLEQADLGKAFAAAVPQALLDTAAMALIPGVGKLFGSVGSKLTTAQAKAIAAQTLKQTALDYAKTTGMAMGREGFTEAAQQVFERLQAGLSITDEEARKEYIDNFIGGAALAGVLGPVGRYTERSGAKTQARKADEEEQAKLAAEAEAAKNTPEALRQLEANYQAAFAQLQDLNKQVEAAKPAKGATEEQEATYAALKKQRTEFVNETFKPLKQEFDQRKDAITQMYESQQAAIEAQVGAAQPTADAPVQNAEPNLDVQRLMDEQEQLRNNLAQLEAQLGQAAPEQFDALNQQRQDLQRRLEARAILIEERGGSPLGQQEFQQATAAKMQAIDTRLEKLNSDYTTALENKDYDAAAKAKDALLTAKQEREALTAKTAQQMQALQEQQTRAQQRGQTLDMFAEAPATQATAIDEQLKQQVLEEEQQRALYGPDSRKASAEQAFEGAQEGPRGQLEQPPTPQEPVAQTGIRKTQLARVEGASQNVAQAQSALTEAVGTKDTPTIYKALDALNQAKNEESVAKEGVGAPTFKPFILDIFNPANLINTAISNGDTALLNNIAAHTDRVTRTAALDEKASERERLINILETRLNLGGADKVEQSGQPLRSIKRERADLFSTLYDAKQQALFKNGTYPNRKLQALYDKGGPAAVEYEVVMDQVEQLSRAVTTKQGNAKQSLVEQMLATYEELQRLQAQLESGIATPTLREKAAGLQAKLGKGDAPAARQMDAKEVHDLKRKIVGTTNKYNMIVGKITPVRDEILARYNSLYKTTPLDKASVVAERKQQESDEAAKGPKAKSRTAATAARIARGDVRKEAETSQQMRDLAKTLGEQDPAYEAFSEQLVRRLDALKAKHGANDPAVNAFRISMGQERIDKAMELGKQAPEYKAVLKEQIEYFKDALSQSKQVVPTKRTTQVTRRQSAAPKTLRVAGSRMTEQEIEAEVRSANASDGGVAYRLKEDEATTTVDAAEAQKTIDGLKLPDNVKFVYAPTAGKIPVRLLKQMAADGVETAEGVVKGAVFPDGTVLVVGDQHADIKDLEQTIAHELIGHYGVDTVIGIDRLNDYAKKTDVIKLAEQVGGKDLVSEVLNTVRALAGQGKSEEVQKLQALREIIAHTEEARVTEAFREKAGRWLKEFIGMVRAGLRGMGFKNLSELSTSDVFYMLKQSRKEFANKTIGPYRAADGSTAFRQRRESHQYITIGKEPGAVDKLLGNFMGLAGRVQFIDQYAALEAATKQGLSKGVISSLEATNANYLLRFGQQRSQFAGQFLTNGPVKVEHVKKEGGTETLYRSVKGTSMMDVAQALNKAGLGNDAEQEVMFTLFLAGKRASDPKVGWDKLHFSDPAKAKAEYESVMARLNGSPEAKKAFEEAAKLYQQYNAGLLDFLVDTGALSTTKAAELKSISYVPFYRINGNGEVQLMIDKEHPVRISNIKDQPQLKELVGGNTAILPIFTSATQNTFMLTGMGLRNQAVKETSFVLRKLGIASRVSEGKGPTGSDVVRFFKNGKEHYAIIDTDQYGIPAELIVRGMEGIKTTLPAIIKAMALPANILRSFVVRNPAYAVRQVIRDPLNAWLTTGTDAAPVLASMKELATMVAGRSEAERKLMETGAISSNVYSGDEQDMARFLKDLSAGRPMWEKALGKLDAFALQGDAATRAVIYKDSLAKGMTEQEALLRTLESMNFSRRGVSPSMQALSIMIPFFNAQIQGLDVIYRAIKGDMPYSEQLAIREKMVRRGLLLAAGTLAYAALMEDDEAYKRAKPEERLANWFVYVPGVAEPVRVPIPFEMGFLFKALPEAVWNVAMQDDKAGKVLSGLSKLAMQTVPLSLPQAVKPLTEAVLGKSFYGGDIESQREKEMLATERYRDSTTEVAKMVGAVTGNVGVSPIMVDHLIRGYTSGLGIALVQLANPMLASDTKAAIAEPSTKISKQPFIGGLFQPVEGRGTLDEAYDRMEEIRKTKGTFNKLVEEGKRAEAQAFAQEYATTLAAMSVSGSVQKRLGEMAKAERQIKAHPTMTTAEKDARLEQLDKAKMALARQFLAVNDRTTRQ
ncbi:MAG: LPD38 domain-containing protein [Betaproteobacteria bacterium]